MCKITSKVRLLVSKTTMGLGCESFEDQLIFSLLAPTQLSVGLFVKSLYSCTKASKEGVNYISLDNLGKPN